MASFAGAGFAWEGAAFRMRGLCLESDSITDLESKLWRENQVV